MAIDYKALHGKRVNVYIEGELRELIRTVDMAVGNPMKDMSFPRVFSASGILESETEGAVVLSKAHYDFEPMRRERSIGIPKSRILTLDYYVGET